MKRIVPLFLLLFFVIFACTKAENSTVMAPNSDSIEGTYSGYRSQQNSQQAAADSTKITLQVTRLPANQVEILQISPNEFKYTVNMQDNRFTYDLGIAEAACGAARIEGKGSFQGNTLHLLETLVCTRSLTAPKTFIQLRATKQ